MNADETEGGLRRRASAPRDPSRAVAEEARAEALAKAVVSAMTDPQDDDEYDDAEWRAAARERRMRDPDEASIVLRRLGWRGRGVPDELAPSWGSEGFVRHYERRVLTSIEAYRTVGILSVVALPLGIAIGLVEVVFASGLAFVTGTRLDNPVALTALLPLAGILIALLYKEFGRGTERGMNLVFEAAESRTAVPLRLAPLVMLSSWLTHLCGGSAGREGVAVQIGATIGDQLGRVFKRLGPLFSESRDTFIVCGIAAGFAGLFQTPLAAIFFSLEVLVCGELKYKSLFPSVVSAFAAQLTAAQFGLTGYRTSIPAVKLSPDLLWKILLLGLLFGVAGAMFAVALKHTKRFLARTLRSSAIRSFSLGVVLAAAFILLHGGRYSGFGEEITQAALSGGGIYAYDWILKLVLTVLTLSAGFQGGELTPLFAIGSSLGAAVAGILGLPPQFVAALGYSALFGSATNTFLAPILIGFECFGADNLPATVVVCAVAFFANFGRSIYGSQKKLGA